MVRLAVDGRVVSGRECGPAAMECRPSLFGMQAATGRGHVYFCGSPMSTFECSLTQPQNFIDTSGHYAIRQDKFFR